MVKHGPSNILLRAHLELRQVRMEHIETLHLYAREQHVMAEIELLLSEVFQCYLVELVRSGWSVKAL